MTPPLWLIALGGLLGSSHCLGMCGGFAMLLGMHRASLRHNLQAQLVFSLGRVFSYATLGGMAGFAGRTLIERLPAMINVPAVLCLLAGLFLLWEGGQATGWLRRSSPPLAAAGCLVAPLFATWLRRPGWVHAFCAGVFTGLLPCGLVYAFVSLAATTGDLLHGAFVMLAFGLGTVPLMVLTGVGTAVLSLAARQRLWRVAAWSVVCVGVLTVGRGISFLQAADSPPASRCPYCAQP